jgi:hypothetical protein
MTTPATEFVFFTLKDSVAPDDASNEEGKALLKVLADAKPKFSALIWSRSVDKPEIMGIGVRKSCLFILNHQIMRSRLQDKRKLLTPAPPTELLDNADSFPLPCLDRFAASPPRTLRVRAHAADLARNPTTEIAILPLKDDLGEQVLATLSDDGARFGAAILAAPPPVKWTGGSMSLTYKCSWAAPTEGEAKHRMVM